MSGIYIHIPFCKNKCAYCDFYSEVQPDMLNIYTDALIREMKLRQSYLNLKQIDTIYFGGGTPSLLGKKQFEQIFEGIHSFFCINDNAEITIEANPDDLTMTYLKTISTFPFNRLSIGIQTFDDTQLKLIHRRHNAKQAIEAVENAKNAGIDNISIDLIYGLPTQTIDSWHEQLRMAFSLDIQHLSAYGLTYEENTPLWKWKNTGVVNPLKDDLMNDMYHSLVKTAEKNGYEHYEVSNFALPNFHSKHNESYWNQIPYLGLGASAHSYDSVSRQWNIPSIKDYIRFVNSNDKYFEIEILSLYDHYNEFIMLSLRTAKGIDLEKLKNRFGQRFYDYCLKNSAKYIRSNKVLRDENHIWLTPEGVIISNIIITDLMMV